MSRRFLRASALGVALTANALRPAKGANPLAIPSFFGAWLTSELAPQNLGITVAGSAAYVAGRRLRGGLTPTDRLALGLNALSAAGLAKMIREGMQAGGVVETALAEGLGADYLSRLDGPPTKSDLATPWKTVLRPWDIKEPRVRRTADIDYVGDGKFRHKLDIYTPRAGGEKLPVVIQVHGGAWIVSQKNQQGIPLMNHLAARDFVCVAPNYPLSPKAKWPEHMVALKRAVAWTRANIAEYGGDPSFITVTGGSAGGHLAAMLGLTAGEPGLQPGFEDADTSVQACVPFYGVYDIANTLGTRAGKQRLDWFLRSVMFGGRDEERYNSATALLHVRPDAPPFFVIHGTHDSLVPVAEARELVRQLREVNKEPVVYAELPGTQHGFDVFHSVRGAHVIRGVERFLRWVHAGYQESAIASGE
ncbi:MAG TPA: alpha/beta hydrolase [Mycobacteriales bacterium]|nr:alpha/beta hydrolase [Mycobacteriales bacterium]